MSRVRTKFWLYVIFQSKVDILSNELTTTSKTNTRSNDPSLLKIRIKRQTKKIAYDEKSNFEILINFLLILSLKFDIGVTPKEVFKEKTSSDKKTPGSDESKIIQHAHIFLIRNVRAQKAVDNFSSRKNTTVNLFQFFYNLFRT